MSAPPSLTETIKEAFFWQGVTSLDSKRDGNDFVVRAEGINISGATEKIIVTCLSDGARQVVQITTSTAESIQTDIENIACFSDILATENPAHSKDTGWHNLVEMVNDATPGSTMTTVSIGLDGTVVTATRDWNSLRKAWAEPSAATHMPETEDATTLSTLVNAYVTKIEETLKIG